MKHARPVDHFPPSLFLGNPTTLTAQQVAESLAFHNPFHERVVHQGRSFRMVIDYRGGGKYRCRAFKS